MKPRTVKRFSLLAILVALTLIIAVGGTTLALGASGMVSWTGNGSENNCENGGSYHWILTPGGTDITSATLTVNGQNFGAGAQSGEGAFQWDVVLAGEVTSATANFEYEGALGNVVLTISDSECNTTTTQPEATTTTSMPEATTTTSMAEGTTTTSMAEGTTTTSMPATTTTSMAEGTTTTSMPATTTTGASTTTTAMQTTTTSGLTTSTTLGGQTTVPTSGTSTTLAPATSTPRPSGIQTGGGGTAGPGAGTWALVVLAGLLAAGLAVSTIRARFSSK